MSIFDDVIAIDTPTNAPQQPEALATDAADSGSGSGFVTMTPDVAPNAFFGGHTIDDHQGHQVHVTPNHYGGQTHSDDQGHADVWMPLPGGGLYHS